MKLYQHLCNMLPQFEEMLSNINNNTSPTLIVGLSDVHKAHFIFSTAMETQKKVLVLTRDEQTARRFVEDINAMNGKEIAYVYPARDFTFRQVESVSREYEQIRLGVLSRLQNNECEVVVCSIEAALQLTLPPTYLKARTFTINKNKDYDVATLMEMLLKCGYTRKPQVEGVAQFSLRGGILDVYAPNQDKPVRIEFWDRQIDTMAYFDITSQRRTDNVSSIKITPATEVLFDNLDTLKQKLQSLLVKTKSLKAAENIKSDIARIEAEYELNSLDKYLPLAYEQSATIFDYFSDECIFVSEYASIKEQSKSFLWQHHEDIKILFEEGELTKGLDKYCEEFSYVQSKIAQSNAVYLDTFARTNADVLYKSLISINPIQTSGWGGELKLLREDITPMLENGYCVAILAGTQKAA
ncbi:MAG: transcription-repair coupling factor, partial [Oscillospiraceae bacterium]